MTFLPALTNLASGKLLTTPSRLLKLVIPLTVGVDTNSNTRGTEFLALLVHPQQPLSYLERLLQAELPLLKNADGENTIPAIHFKAEDSQQDVIEPKSKHDKTDETVEDMYDGAQEGGQLEQVLFEGKTEKTGKLGRNAAFHEEVAPLETAAFKQLRA